MIDRSCMIQRCSKLIHSHLSWLCSITTHRFRWHVPCKKHVWTKQQQRCFISTNSIQQLTCSNGGLFCAHMGGWLLPQCMSFMGCLKLSNMSGKSGKWWETAGKQNQTLRYITLLYATLRYISDSRQFPMFPMFPIQRPARCCAASGGVVHLGFRWHQTGAIHWLL